MRSLDDISQAFVLRTSGASHLRARDRAMLVGVGLNEARIDSKAVTTDEAGRDAYPDDMLEHTAEYIALEEALAAGTREHRMIGDLVLDAEATEPAIGEIEPDLAAQRAFRANGEYVPDDEHPVLSHAPIEERPIRE